MVTRKGPRALGVAEGVPRAGFAAAVVRGEGCWPAAPAEGSAGAAGGSEPGAGPAPPPRGSRPSLHLRRRSLTRPRPGAVTQPIPAVRA